MGVSQCHVVASYKVCAISEITHRASVYPIVLLTGIVTIISYQYSVFGNDIALRGRLVSQGNPLSFELNNGLRGIGHQKVSIFLED